MQGIDISSNNHAGERFNFGAAKAAGYDFCYVKATQGDNYLNPYMVADVRDAANNGMFVGLYHYFDPKHGTPEQQAQFFYRNGIMQPVGDNPDSHMEDWLTLIPMFDYEEG